MGSREEGEAPVAAADGSSEQGESNGAEELATPPAGRQVGTLYDQVGGPEALATAVTVFYRRVLADPMLAPWFTDVDLRRLKSHQRAFLAAALGGPDVFAGRDLGRAHVGLGIDDAAFDAVADHLASTLRDLGVDTQVVARVDEHVAALRPAIVTVSGDGALSEGGGGRSTGY